MILLIRSNSLRVSLLRQQRPEQKAPQNQLVVTASATILDKAFAISRKRAARSSKGRRPPDNGWRSERGSRGQGLVTFAPGRLRDNARPALRPVCDLVAGLGQAEADNARLLAASQEVRLKLSGGVGSLPQVPQWNAVRRARCASARAAPAGAAVGLRACRRSASFLFRAVPDRDPSGTPLPE